MHMKKLTVVLLLVAAGSLGFALGGVTSFAQNTDADLPHVSVLNDNVDLVYVDVGDSQVPCMFVVRRSLGVGMSCDWSSFDPGGVID